MLEDKIRLTGLKWTYQDIKPQQPLSELTKFVTLTSETQAES